MSSELLVIGAIGVAGYLYYTTQLSQLQTAPGTALGIGGDAGSIINDVGSTLSNIFTQPPQTPEQTKAAADKVVDTIKANVPTGKDRADLPAWAQTVFGVNDAAKELIGDVVLAKTISSLVNESGQRKSLAQYRASQALQKKQDAARMKLANLEAKKANMAALNQKYNTQIESVNLQRQQAKIDKIEKQKQQLKELGRTSAIDAGKQQATVALNTSHNVNVVKARQEATNSGKLFGKSNSVKASIGIMKQRIQNKFAKIMNNTRAQFGRQLASIKLPKFTLRGSVHTGASMFGLLVAAYDLARMFDPSIDLWKMNRPGGTPKPTEDVPYTVVEPLPSFNFPLCDDIVEQGLVNGTTPMLCRENRPKPWEKLGSTGLTYDFECPPGFQTLQWGPYKRCTLATNYSGEWYDKDAHPRKSYMWNSIIRSSGYAGQMTGFWWNYPSGDVVEGNAPNVFAALPEEYFVRLGLRGFVNDLNLHMQDVQPFKEEKSVGTPPPTWDAGIAYSIDTPQAPFKGQRFFNAANKWSASGAELEDPDWPYQQYKNQDDWGRYAGARVTNTRFLGDFPMPYTDIGLSVRGGNDLTEEQRMAILFPDATADEKETAIEAANEDLIRGADEM